MTPRKFRLSGNPWVERWDVIGSRGDTYVVSKRQDGSYGCSCPAWRFARAPKPDCRHIIATIADTALPTLAPVPAPNYSPNRIVAQTRGIPVERFTVKRKIREEL